MYYLLSIIVGIVFFSLILYSILKSTNSNKLYEIVFFIFFLLLHRGIHVGEQLLKITLQI